MPHCEAFLYDAVLAANWTADALRRTAVLGNAFEQYAERVLAGRTRADCEHVLKALSRARGASAFF
jgi:hypothetical protein